MLYTLYSDLQYYVYIHDNVIYHGMVWSTSLRQSPTGPLELRPGPLGGEGYSGADQGGGAGLEEAARRTAQETQKRESNQLHTDGDKSGLWCNCQVQYIHVA